MASRLIQTFAGAAAVWLAAGAGGQVAPAAPPDTAERAYLSANGLLNRGMYELASDEYRKFLAAAPQHEKAPVARYGLAVCLSRLKDYDGAGAELDRLRGVKDFQFAAEVGLLSAQADMAREKFADAAAHAERTIKEHRDSPVADDAAAILAEARYRTGDFAGARQASDMLAQAWPESPARGRADLIWGLAAAAMGEDKEAAERLTALVQAHPDSGTTDQALLAAAQARHRLGDLDSSQSLYEQLIARPKSGLTADGLVGLGTLLHAKGDLAQAGRMLDRVVKEFASAAAAPTAKMERGRVWLDAGDAGRARASFQEAAEGGGVPGDQAAFWLARCDLHEGNANAAAERLGRAITEFPKSTIAPELRFDRAAALVRAGDDQRASADLAEFESAFGGHPLMPDAVEAHAGAAHRLADYAQSRALCERFLTAYPAHPHAPEVRFLGAEDDLLAGNPEAAAAGYAVVLAAKPGAELAGRASFRLGTVLYRLGRVDEAEPLLTAVTGGRTTRPEFRPALLSLGDAYFQKGRWAQAERTLGDYLAVGTDSADDALLKLGLCAAHQDRPADAAARFDELLARFADSPLADRAQFEKGQALVALGKPREAQAAFEAVLARPDGPLIGPAESALGNLSMAAGDSAAGAEHFSRAAAATKDPAGAGEAQFQRAQALLTAGKYPEAAEVFSGFASAYPAHARQKAAAAQRGVALRRAGKAAESLAAFEGVEGAPGDPLDPAMQESVLYEKARALQETGRKEDAGAVYRHVIDHAGGALAVYAMVDLAALESDAGREAEAGVLLTRATDASRAADGPPELRTEAAYRLGASLFKQGRHADAAKALGPLIDGPAPGDLLAPALRLRAQARMASGHASQAGADYARLTKEFSAAPAAAEDLLGLGESLAAAQDWRGSERAMAGYLERFSSGDLWFRARFGLGWARENQSRQEEAMADYAPVVEGHQGPTAARAQFQTGECLFALRRYDEAVKEFVKVDILYAYPEWSAAALYEAGRCFVQMKKPADAAAQFAAVTEKYASTDWAKLAATELASLKTAGPPAR